MPSITVARDKIETDTPQSVEDLKPFEAAVRHALDNLSAMLANPE